MGDKNTKHKRPANPTPASTREQRRAEGEARNTAWRGLTAAQQLASLDGRLGVGVGAARQRRKLA